MGAGYASLILGALPSHRGVMDTSRWSAGCRCRDVRDPHRRTSQWSPSRGNHRRRAGDARTRPDCRFDARLLDGSASNTTAPVASKRVARGPALSAETLRTVLDHPGQRNRATESPSVRPNKSLTTVERMHPNGGCGRRRRTAQNRGITGRLSRCWSWKNAPSTVRTSRAPISMGRWSCCASSPSRTMLDGRVAAALRDRAQDAAARCLADRVLRSRRATGRERVDGERAGHDDVRRRRRDHR